MPKSNVDAHKQDVCIKFSTCSPSKPNRLCALMIRTQDFAADMDNVNAGYFDLVGRRRAKLLSEGKEIGFGMKGR